MKNRSKVFVFTLIIMLLLAPIPSVLSDALAQDTIHDFHQRMNTVYKQDDEETLLQQIIFGSLEAFATFKLGSFITEPDRKEISAIALQIRALEDTRDTKYLPAETQLSDRERNAKINLLKRRLRSIEGGLGQRMSRGTAKFFIRGAQVLLILDFGSRIYVLTALDRRDPGTIPLKTMFCSEIDCRATVYKMMGLQRPNNQG